MNFLIVVTGYNCAGYVKKCYDSIMEQEYPDFRAVFISDGSTDETETELIKNVKGKNVFVEIAGYNLGAAKRRYEAIQKYGNKLDVVVFLGMDDALFPQALRAIAMKYYDGMWMTYGNWINQFGEKLPEGFLEFKKETHDARDYRKVPYRSTAPNTFYKFLFDRIPKEDFIIDGKWIDTTTESEVMFSCLEMCGEKRIGIIQEPIYLYNQRGAQSCSKRLGRDYKYEVLAKITAREKRNLLTDYDFGK